MAGGSCSVARLSVIVPVLNDAAPLGALLPRLRAVAPGAEVIVADGGSVDGSDVVAEAEGALLVPSAPGRGTQLNAGAARAGGDVLWFLHADVGVPDDAQCAIEEALRDPTVAGGAFRFRLAERHWYAPLLDTTVNLRSRWLRRPYGDQGLFVRAAAFHELGGFRPYPILEDLDFVRRLRRHGRLVLLRSALQVSARRWEREGFWRVTLRNQLLAAAYRCGISPHRLAARYAPSSEGTQS